MFIGTMSDVRLASKLHPKFKEFFDFVKSHDFEKIPLGRVEIDGDDVFVNNVLVDGVDASVQPLEMHREYIDVHVLLAGKERIGYKPLERIKTFSKEYSAEGDCALSTDEPDFHIDMEPGDFCIVFPEDPHAPAISDGKIRKLIGKIKVNS